MLAKPIELLIIRLQRFLHSSIPALGELGICFLIDLIFSFDRMYVLCNAISGNSKTRVLIVTTPLIIKK